MAPAGGWAAGDPLFPALLADQAKLHDDAGAAAPHAAAILSVPAGRRRATALLTTNFEHIPADLLVHQLLGVAGCRGAGDDRRGLCAGDPDLDAEPQLDVPLEAARLILGFTTV